MGSAAIRARLGCVPRHGVGFLAAPVAVGSRLVAATALASGGDKPVIHSRGHRGSVVGFGRQRIDLPLTRRTTMTDDMMPLRSLLEKSADADLLREMIGFSAQRLMELEVQGLTGA